MEDTVERLDGLRQIRHDLHAPIGALKLLLSAKDSSLKERNEILELVLQALERCLHKIESLE
jgi:hypothetical protein